MLPKINPTTTPSWKALEDHFATSRLDLRRLFESDPHRFAKFSVQTKDFIFDYSKNLIDDTTFKLLLQLTEDCDVKSAIQQMFSGEKINETENRAVLHTALRDFSTEPIFVDGQNVKPNIQSVLHQMRDFSNAVINGEHTGYTNKPFTDIVNIGIGGSDLGPSMVCTALQHYQTNLNVHFVSNVDAAHISELLKKLNPETTLFIVASKTFTTQETMTNAETAKEWLLENTTTDAIAKHFVALSTNIPKVSEFGIQPEFTFKFWDWVGGRYSLWSAIGLSICLAVGYDNFIELLNGAHTIDQHFLNTDFDQNIPVLMALLGIWYRNFYDAKTYAILPYSEYMTRFPAYLQQADMESNGKSVDRNGEFVNYETGPIIWGESGTNGQHAFFQLIHQGTEMVPSDFIGFINPCENISDHQAKLMANFFAQTEALAFGQTEEELINFNNDCKNLLNEAERLKLFKTFLGNIPTNTLLFEKLTPYNLGQIIALYEHKIFVQGVIWNIFSFDQYGVELGKCLAGTILNDLQSKDAIHAHDSSTTGLINYFRSKRDAL